MEKISPTHRGQIISDGGLSKSDLGREVNGEVFEDRSGVKRTECRLAFRHFIFSCLWAQKKPPELADRRGHFLRVLMLSAALLSGSSCGFS